MMMWTTKPSTALVATIVITVLASWLLFLSLRHRVHAGLEIGNPRRPELGQSDEKYVEHILQKLDSLERTAGDLSAELITRRGTSAGGVPPSHGADPTPNCIGVDGVMLGKVGSGRFEGKTCNTGWNGAPTQSVAGHKRCRG
jgi:hypothetical protein